MEESQNKIIVKEVKATTLITPSKLPSADFVINPYVGCTNACRYCYASFMKRFTDHPEPWGEFLDVKICNKTIDLKKLKGKSVFLASVTDAYNHYEKEYKKTRGILEQLVGLDCEITISTKNDLILRDLDLLKQMKNLTVAFSINTTNEQFKDDMDKASSIKNRFESLQTLYENGIRTAVFISPMFPEITEWKDIISTSKNYINEYWFENLNLRGDYKRVILDYIKKNYPNLWTLYCDIYLRGNVLYWDSLAKEIESFCKKENVEMKNYFYHDKIKKQ